MTESSLLSVDVRDLHINKSELAQRLKTPVGFEHETVSECEEILKRICTPKYSFIKVKITTEDADTVFLDGLKVVSKDLFKNLRGCTDGYIMAMTLGMEVDRKILSFGITSPAKGFILDAVASAYAESLADHVSTIIADGKKLRPRYSPGYGDLSLDVQKDVLGILNADKLMGIKLGANMLMTPKKSVTAIQGVEL